MRRTCQFQASFARVNLDKSRGSLRITQTKPFNFAARPARARASVGTYAKCSGFIKTLQRRSASPVSQIKSPCAASNVRFQIELGEIDRVGPIVHQSFEDTLRKRD